MICAALVLYDIRRVGQNHIYGVYTVFLAGKSSNIRSYTVYITVLANPRHMLCEYKPHLLYESYKTHEYAQWLTVT